MLAENPVVKKSGRGSNFKKGSASLHRYSGSPAFKEVKDGPSWNMTPSQPKRRPNDSSTNSPEKLLKILEEMKDAEIATLKTTVDNLNRQLTLRASSNPTPVPDTTHYIPGYYAGKRGDRCGRALNRDTLRTVASVCASGQQYEKFELQRVLNEEESVAETTFYRNAKYCWWASKEVFNDYQTGLVKKLILEKKVNDISSDFSS